MKMENQHAYDRVQWWARQHAARKQGEEEKCPRESTEEPWRRDPRTDLSLLGERRTYRLRDLCAPSERQRSPFLHEHRSHLLVCDSISPNVEHISSRSRRLLHLDHGDLIRAKMVVGGRKFHDRMGRRGAGRHWSFDGRQGWGRIVASPDGSHAIVADGWMRGSAHGRDALAAIT